MTFVKNYYNLFVNLNDNSQHHRFGKNFPIIKTRLGRGEWKKANRDDVGKINKGS